MTAVEIIPNAVKKQQANNPNNCPNKTILNINIKYIGEVSI